MAVIKPTNVQVLVRPAQIFNAEIITDAVQMDNSQAVHFVVASGAGEKKTIVGSVMAKRADREDFHVREIEVTIGDNAESRVMITAREIASDDGTSVYLRLPNAEVADVNGIIFCVKTNERYSGGGHELTQ
jgi:hypothetical protein